MTFISLQSTLNEILNVWITLLIMPVELLYFSNKSKVLFDFNIILSLYYKDLLTIQNK